MHVKLRALGWPGAPSGEQTLALDTGTLAEAVARLAQHCPGSPSKECAPLILVNGRVERDDWADVALEDGDVITVVAPVSGG